jgi:hypothetical protein
MFAAEVRRRAADDVSFLPPPAGTVKLQVIGRSEIRHQGIQASGDQALAPAAGPTSVR